ANAIGMSHRTNAQSRAIEDTISTSQNAYQMIVGLKFYELKEIKDIIAYLRLITNPHDDLSFERIVNVPRRGIGATSIERLRAYALEHGISFYDAIKEIDFTGVTARAANAFDTFKTMIDKLIQQQDFLSATDMVNQVLEVTEYEASIEKEGTIEAQSRLENIDEFKTVTQDFEKTSEDDKTLVAF